MAELEGRIAAQPLLLDGVESLAAHLLTGPHGRAPLPAETAAARALAEALEDCGAADALFE